MELAWFGRAALAFALLFSSPLHGRQSEPDSVVSRPHGPARSKGACGPCCGKNPAAEARATQGISAANPANPYVGKDRYDNVVVREGTLFYSLTPGSSPGFAVSYPTLEKAGGSLTTYYELVQVTTDPGKDAAGLPRSLRDKVRVFRVTEHICAARGKALANPQFGRGGGTQYYLSPADAAKLSPERIRPI
jgi:hypothetical protein